MDNYRTFFIFGLLIVSLLLWEAWQNDYVRPQQQAAQQAATQVQDAPDMTADLPDLPAASSFDSAADMPALPAGASAISSSERVRITTDVIDAYIDTQGGDIRSLALLQHFEEAGATDRPVQFLDDSSSLFFVTQSGLRSDSTAPTHHDRFRAEADSYTLQEGQDSIKVPLHWQSEDGLQVVKTYTFHRDSYLVDVEYQVINNTGERFAAYPYAQLNRARAGRDSFLLYTYTGPVFSSPGNEYDKVTFDDLEKNPLRRSAASGWVAMLQHYFVAAVIPDQSVDEMGFYGNSVSDNNFIAGIRFPAIAAQSGDTAQTSFQLYLGPKEYPRLQAAAENLDLTVDFGMLTIISKPLFIVMEWFYKLTGNWGWSIVLLTLLIKLVFYRLSAASYRSMASMRKLTPKLASLKERYGDDKQKFNQAMMDLYRTEKINPLGGCLPILVQMPVFLAFYWVLVESIELRHAPFMFWIQDLTAIDPYFILPVLFGLTMWFQQKLNPMPQDPAQAMMMKIFPIVFTVFFAFFPSGLVLYWLVNNILSIAQQWHITRKMGAL